MTSYPSTEYPCAGRATENQKPPPPSSKYFLSLSPSQVDAKIFFRSKKPPRSYLLLTTRRYYKEVLLGGYLLDTIEIICFPL